MILADVKLQEVLCREIPATIRAPIRMYLGIMNLKFLEGGK